MRAWTLGAFLALAAACTGAGPDADRRAEVARKVAEAEGASAPGDAGARPTRAPLAIARETASASPPPAAEPPPTPAQSAWASAIGHAIDSLDRRSRQLLEVRILRAANDPGQKSQELFAHMQWCDEGSLEACLHVGHVLLFNECLFERARDYYEKAGSLADDLPAAAVDDFTVDGQPQRYELRLGLRFSDPANRGDEQVRAVAAVCGAVAERDRPLWDDMFARYAGGERTGAALASSGEERLALGALRKKVIFELEERIVSLEKVHAGLARDLQGRLAGTASDLCGDGDALSCAAASFLYASACNLPQMEDAYRRFESSLSSLDAGSRSQALELARDVVGPVRAYVEGDERTRGLLRRSLCGGRA
jgi:hypothetical protein